MKFTLARAVSVLSRTPASLDALLRDQPEEWIHCKEGPESWSPFDVVGHLAHGERTDWIPRVRMILDHGEAETFEPFDRFGMFAASRGKTVNELLDEFAEVRADSLRTLEDLRISPGDLRRTGRHPSFGPVTLEHLMAAWVVHDLGHVRQITRVMAKQLREAIGPWSQFLPVVTE
ncbi:MAG TPA: DinB family protein [bacterium]|nr:DinB family protein [bacterium]